MPELAEATKERLKNFSESADFEKLSPATQERLKSYLNIEEEQAPKPDTPIQSFMKLFTKEGADKLPVTSPAMSLDSLTGAGKALSAIGQATEAPIATTISKLQSPEATSLVVGGIPSFAADAVKNPKSAISLTKNIVNAPIEGLIGSNPKMYGDIYRDAGAPEGVAATMGLITSMAFDPTMIRQTLVNSGVKGVENVLEKGGRAIKLLKMKNPMEELNLQKAAVDAGIDTKIANTTKKIQDLSAKFNEQIRKSSYETAINFQEELPKFFKSNSEEYGRQLFDISESIPKENMLKVGELDDLFGETLQQMKEQNALSGGLANRIKNIAKKYNIEVIENNKDGTFDIITKDPDKVVLFKNFVEDMRDIKKGLSSKVKSGRGRWTDDDRAFAIMQSNFGEVVADRVPMFNVLQSKYRNVIQLMDDANKIFVPYRKGTLSTKSGESFLQKVATGKGTISEETFLDKLQKGVDEFKGVGNLTGRLNRIARRASNIKEFGQQMIDMAKVERANANSKYIAAAKSAKELWEKASKVKTLGKRVAGVGMAIILYQLLQRPIRMALNKIGYGGEGYSE